MSEVPEKPLLVVHAGFHKTGTSTLQEILSLAVAERPRGFLYPEAGRLPSWPKAHHLLVQQLGERDLSGLEALRAEARARPGDRIVLSCENFAYLGRVLTLGYLRDAFPDYRLRVVLVVRNHIDYVRSFYLEKLKRFETVSEPMQYVYEHREGLKFNGALRGLEVLGIEFEVLCYGPGLGYRQLYERLTGEPLDFAYDWRLNSSLSVPGSLALAALLRRAPELGRDMDRTIHNMYLIDDLLRDGLAPSDIFAAEEIAELWELFAVDRHIVAGYLDPSADAERFATMPAPLGPKLVAGTAAVEDYLALFLARKP